MRAYRPAPRGLSALQRGRTDIERELEEEIAFHVEMRTAQLEREGMSRLDAEERAVREFGNYSALRETVVTMGARDARRLAVAQWVEDFAQDVRFALRTFARRPSFALVASGTIALGIGVTVGMFSVLDAVLLRPLPYAEPDRLVQISPAQSFNVTLADEVLRDASALEAATGVSHWNITLTGAGEAVQLSAQVVDAGYFDVFAVRPAYGTGFTAEHRDPARSDVVILSHRLWQTRLGGDRSIIGRRLRLDGYGHSVREVIGIMPPDFVPVLESSAQPVDMWIPLSVRSGLTVATDGSWYVSYVFGRLGPGATLDRLENEIRVGTQRMHAEYPSLVTQEAVQRAQAVRLLDVVSGELRRPLWLLMGSVALLLLLTCANVANLLLARADTRRQELAARAALGGTRARLVRELLTESAVLATVGALAGTFIAFGLIRTFGVARVLGIQNVATITFDVRVFGFAVLATAVCVALFALLPALRATQGELRPDLAAGGRIAGQSGRQLGPVLIAGEVALAMLLVTGATLLMLSMRGILSVDSGMHVDDVLAVQLAPSTCYPCADAAALASDLERTDVFFRDAIERLAALPGVRTVGAIHLLPFTDDNWRFPYLAEGHAPPVNAPLPAANYRVVRPNYFASVDVAILEGRDVADTDRMDTGAVMLVNQRMARDLWPGESAVGRTISIFGDQPHRIIGVVSDVHQHALDQESEPEMYVPQSQSQVTAMIVMLETDRNPAALVQPVRDVVSSISSEVSVVRALPLREVLSESVARRRFFARVLTLFALLGLALGAVGVYGVTSYVLSARVREYGVRLALGATHAQLLRGALRNGLQPVAIGLAAGTAAAVAGSRVLEGLLFGVTRHDPRALIVAALVLGMIAAVAAWLPARRVRRVQPAQALHR